MTLDRTALVKSGRILTDTLGMLVAEVRPGVTTGHLDHLAEEFIRSHRGAPAFLGHLGFPSSLCTSVNSEVVHGLPGDYALQEGDILSIDAGVKFDGWFTDSAITVPVGEISSEAARLLAVTAQALTLALEQARDGQTTGDLGAAVQGYVEGEGFGIVRDCVGHGIGRKLHEEPSIPNYGKRGSGTAFKQDMVVAIEPMVTAGSPEVAVGDDHWTVRTRDGSLAAHFEETVIITAGRPERLTPLDGLLPGVTTPDRLGKVTKSPKAT